MKDHSIQPKRIAARYFSRWWLPFAAAFCAVVAWVALSASAMAFGFAEDLRLFATGLLVLLVFCSLGILVAAVSDLVKKRWAKGLVNSLVMLPLFILAASSGFAVLMAASMLAPAENGFGQAIVVPPDREGQRPRLKVALMLQSYDPWDAGFSGSFIRLVWESCLKWGEGRCNIKFDLTVLSEEDVIADKLEQDGFDVLIGPGGSGTWHAKAELRERIRDYISNGGNYLGVCGDAVFGTLGFTNLSPRLEEVFLRQAAGAPCLEPFLEAANVYTDLSAVEQMADWEIGSGLFGLLFCPVNFHFPETGMPTLKAYGTRTRRVNWALMMAVPGDRTSMAPVNIDIEYADDWMFPRGALKGKAAQVSTTYGKGRIILTGLHAEFSRRTYDIVIRNLLWLANLESSLEPTAPADVEHHVAQL